jgi:hypothetical protein
MRWERENDNQTFNVYRSESGDTGNYVRLNTAKLLFTQNVTASAAWPNYVDTTADIKKQYWYKVVGVDVFNGEGMFSPAITPE